LLKKARCQILGKIADRSGRPARGIVVVHC
jgi:hypothetical protein